ncbi:MAG: orotidine-5'-phosphate decarboxylase [Planctomycetota bacterium]
MHPDAPDAITVNGYLGADGITPFADAAAEGGQGVFVLVRTSNPSAATLQDVADASGTRVYEHAARMVAELGDAAGVGECGYSSVGAVVGATWPAEARALRELMPRQIFLVPGYGAQGASAEDCAASFKEGGAGAIVNASRSVTYAFAEDTGRPWREAVADAAKAFAGDITAAVGM